MCAVHAHPRRGPARRAGPAVGGRDRQPARAGGPRRRRLDRLGRLRARLRHHPRPHQPRRPRLRELQRARSGARAASCCRTDRATRARFATATGKAMITVNELEPVERPRGPADPADHALARPVQHDDLQPERPLPRHQEGPRRRVRQPGRPRRARPRPTAQRVDIFSEWPDEPDRVLRDYRVVAYPTARGCAAAYFPEANVLVPLASAAIGSNTPVSKAIVVRLDKVQA